MRLRRLSRFHISSAWSEVAVLSAAVLPVLYALAWISFFGVSLRFSALYGVLPLGALHPLGVAIWLPLFGGLLGGGCGSSLVSHLCILWGLCRTLPSFVLVDLLVPKPSICRMVLSVRSVTSRVERFSPFLPFVLQWLASWELGSWLCRLGCLLWRRVLCCTPCMLDLFVGFFKSFRGYIWVTKK